MASETDCVKEISINAAPETIFPFFIEPDKMLLWMGIKAKLDPVPGGVFWVSVTGEEIASGEYVLIDAPRKVVFTFGWEGESGAVPPPGSTTVEITLTPMAGSTLVRLVHSGLPTPKSASAHGKGWDHYFERLQVRIGGGDPGLDPWLDPSSP